jgi:hypothetical protein
MRMHGLSTRRRFALGLAAVGAFPLASRGLFRFAPADAATRAERNAPIAPVVPKAFEEFGGVRIDNYDWLRDRRTHGSSPISMRRMPMPTRDSSRSSR